MGGRVTGKEQDDEMGWGSNEIFGVVGGTNCGR